LGYLTPDRRSRQPAPRGAAPSGVSNRPPRGRRPRTHGRSTHMGDDHDTNNDRYGPRSRARIVTFQHGVRPTGGVPQVPSHDPDQSQLPAIDPLAEYASLPQLNTTYPII